MDDTPPKLKTLTMKLLCFLMGLFFCHTLSAITPPGFPASADPGRISQALTPIPTAQPLSGAPIKRTPPPAPSTLGKQAEKIKFKLTKITLEGNHVFSDCQLMQIYYKKLNTVITVAELQQIVENISNHYRNKGYILTRAILPPQHIKKDGVVHVRVIEGYISKVHIIGNVQGPGRILRAYAKRITCSRPLQLKVLEKYLLLANQLPGVQVKSVIEPSATETGASDLDLIVNFNHLGGYLSYDNYGTRYLGPQQGTLNVQLNSIFRSTDSTSITYVNTMRPQELKYIDVAHDTPLCGNGSRLVLDFNEALTKPLFALRPFKVDGRADNYYMAFRYPLLVSRQRNINLESGFSYMDSRVTTFGFDLYTDHIRSLKFLASYDFSDKYRGANLWGLLLEKGLPIMGATTDTHSLTTSRFGGTANFFKFGLQASRLQPIKGRYSLYFLSRGQYSFEPLLAAEQFGYGGSQLGRGYDPAEIIGDRGFAGSLELRADFSPEKFFMQAFQLYVFYDEGVIWNIKKIIGVKQKQSAASTGAGSRFYFTKNITGNFMMTQPLTKQVAALQLIGNGRCPRLFFSVTASV